MCAHVIDSIQRALHHGSLEHLAPEDLAHIQRCPTCRGGMLLLAETLGLAPAPAFPTCTCDECQAGLAAYIDDERREPASAAAAAPAIWWHLWACPQCGEAYRLSSLMLDAAAQGELPPLPGAR